MSDLPTMPTASSRNLPRAPAHLQAIERRLWRDIVSVFRFTDSASQAMLRVALEAHMRARRCREAIDKDGESVRDRFGQVRAHPLLAAERDARASFIASMKTLNLDLGVQS